jgi:hypothetical protein
VGLDPTFSNPVKTDRPGSWNCPITDLN